MEIVAVLLGFMLFELYVIKKKFIEEDLVYEIPTDPFKLTVSEKFSVEESFVPWGMLGNVGNFFSCHHQMQCYPTVTGQLRSRILFLILQCMEKFYKTKTHA